MTVRPYILAGGRSSRMGQDKAMLRLGGRTLLRRAVDSLRAVTSLRDSEGRVIVTIVGDRAALEGADRVIADRHPGCGPLGGMEAALRDLQENGGAEWALFVPVDMPFLPAALIDALLEEWTEAGRCGAKICCIEVDERPQPLVSVLHKATLPSVLEALTAGQFKVTPVLQSAAHILASHLSDGIRYSQSAMHKTPVSSSDFGTAVAGWVPPVEQEKFKRLWFSNLNTDEEFRAAETFASSLGSN